MENLYCIECGHKLLEDDVFCIMCGTRVEPPSESSSPCPAAPESGRPDRKKNGWKTAFNILTVFFAVVQAITKGVGCFVGGLAALVLALIAGIWLCGAYNAHNDVEHHKPLGVLVQRMYGTEYNPLTRHGYRMYIKHFTTDKPASEISDEDLKKRFQNALRETAEDLDAYFDDKGKKPEDQALRRFRENLADAAGDVARGKGNISDEVEAAVGAFLVDALSNTSGKDEKEK